MGSKPLNSKFAVDGGCHMWAGNAYSSGAPDSAPWTMSWGSILVFYIQDLTNLRVFKSWPDGCRSVLIVYFKVWAGDAAGG